MPSRSPIARSPRSPRPCAVGETSSRELTDACLERIDRDAERLNTFLAVDADARALDAADAADAALGRGEGDGSAAARASPTR